MLGYILTLCISAILLLPAFEALTHEDDKRALLDLFNQRSDQAARQRLAFEGVPVRDSEER